MRWTLSDDQELFQDSFAQWLERFAPTDAVRRWLETGDPTEFERRFVSEGWFGVGSPVDAGGQGGSLVELALAAEQLGRAAAPSAAWLSSVLAIPALSAQPELGAAALEAGEFAALAVRADRPVDVRPVITTEGGLLHGAVPMVLGGDRAHRFVVPVDDADGVSLFVVEAADVELAPRILLDHSRSMADVRFDGARGSKLDVDLDIGVPGVLTETALRAAVLVAADSLGAAQRLLDLAVTYSMQREQFGAPIGSFQAVQHAAAEMLVAVESSRSLVYYAAASIEQGHQDAALHAAAAKAQVCAAAERVADSSLTVHGAIGYTWEHDLQLFYKRTRLNSKLYGAPSVWNERIAAELPLVPAG